MDPFTLAALLWAPQPQFPHQDECRRMAAYCRAEYVYYWRGLGHPGWDVYYYEAGVALDAWKLAAECQDFTYTRHDAAKRLRQFIGWGDFANGILPFPPSLRGPANYDRWLKFLHDP